jgi:hypothetical protein
LLTRGLGSWMQVMTMHRPNEQAMADRACSGSISSECRR